MFLPKSVVIYLESVDISPYWYHPFHKNAGSCNGMHHKLDPFYDRNRLPTISSTFSEMLPRAAALYACSCSSYCLDAGGVFNMTYMHCMHAYGFVLFSCKCTLKIVLAN